MKNAWVRSAALRGIVMLGWGALPLSLGACLEPGDPVLLERDVEPPTLIRSTPAAAGQIGRADPIVLVFSEPMDPLSLRGGIKIQKDGSEDPIPIVVAVQPEGPDAAPIEVRGNEEFLVEVRSEVAGGFDANSAYTLVLTTGLSDTEGNALGAEIRIAFTTGA